KSSVTFIAQLMGISWGALAGSFLAPFLYSLYWKGTTKASCWASFAFGSGLMIINMLWRPALPEIMRSPINSGAIAMLAGFVIVPLVSLVTKAPDRRFTDALFACYERPRQVTAKNDLGE
ncbi:MAG: sodium:solute symporter, partial [Kiritimatiellae bacterium]|nr:sodium:solute symporter [Kiritimatiellia bacterium]